MADYTFFGKIHPERAGLNMTEPTTLRGQKDGEQIFELVIHAYANQIIVRAKISEDLGFDLPTVRNFVTEHVQSVIDLCAFLYQTGYEVEICSVINNDDPSFAQTFGVRLEITGEDLEQRARQFSDLAPIIAYSPYVPLALSDLRLAIKSPIDTAVYCYRAFESILHDFEVGPDSGGKGKYDIKRMGKELNIGSAKKLKTYLGKHAGARRHGDAVVISWEERRDVMKRVWFLMDRYLEYLKRARTPLPKTEFPEPVFSNL